MALPCSKKDLEGQISWKEDCEEKPARRVVDTCMLAKMDELIAAVGDIEAGTGGGGIKCQDVVIDLVADTYVNVPHTFQDEVCDFKVFDTLGNQIEVSSRLSGIVLELCSTANLTNILVIVEGE